MERVSGRMHEVVELRLVECKTLLPEPKRQDSGESTSRKRT